MIALEFAQKPVRPSLTYSDEWHHGASAGAQKVLMAVSSKFVYSVSVTPARGDHLERINNMLLGPTRMTYTARERAEA